MQHLTPQMNQHWATRNLLAADPSAPQYQIYCWKCRTRWASFREVILEPTFAGDTFSLLVSLNLSLEFQYIQFISVTWCLLIISTHIRIWADPRWCWKFRGSGLSTILTEIPCMILPKITRKHCFGCYWKDSNSSQQKVSISHQN